MFFKLLFPAIFLAGAYFLFRSISRIVQVYAGAKIEFSAKTASNAIKIDRVGDYEIAYKRPSLIGVIPANCIFTLVKDADQHELRVVSALNMLGMRKDMSGNRVVPIAEFNITEPGAYTLHITESVSFKEGDKLLITAKMGSKGFLAIFAIIISAIATIAGFVLSMLAWMNEFG